MAREESNQAGHPEQTSSNFTTDISGGRVENVINAAGDVVIQHHTSGLFALHQLPPPPADFTGREDELNELFHLIETGGVTISGLRGMGGIGKTSLALTLAHRLKQNYPDAQFYLDLKGDDKQTALNSFQAMSHIIRSYKSDLDLPETESTLKALYYSMLDGKKALLLMDNALDDRQVLPLLPPSSCILIVTSRQHFNLPGLFAKNINTLAPADANSFLLKVAPRIGKHAADIAALCGYLPLALRLAANALVRRVSLTPSEYLAQLSKEQERLKLIDASISLSYKMLSPEMQKLWRTLSVFRGTFVISMAAELWELELDTTQSALDEMTSYSLVEWEENSRLYRLHDLVRVFANAQLSEDEVETAWKRRTTRLTKESFRQQRDKIIDGYEPREREAVLYLIWLRERIYKAYIERANYENRKPHPAIHGIESIVESFTELLSYYRKYTSLLRSKGKTWVQVKSIEASLLQGKDVGDPALEEEQKFLVEHKEIINKLRMVEATLYVTENFIGLIGDLIHYLDIVGNIETFEKKFESALELVLTAIALGKESIKDDYTDSSTY